MSEANEEFYIILLRKKLFESAYILYRCITKIKAMDLDFFKKPKIYFEYEPAKRASKIFGKVF